MTAFSTCSWFRLKTRFESVPPARIYILPEKRTTWPPRMKASTWECHVTKRKTECLIRPAAPAQNIACQHLDCQLERCKMSETSEGPGLPPPPGSAKLGRGGGINRIKALRCGGTQGNAVVEQHPAKTCDLHCFFSKAL